MRDDLLTATALSLVMVLATGMAHGQDQTRDNTQTPAPAAANDADPDGITYAEESRRGGNAQTRSRNLLLRARDMAREDETADFAEETDNPANAPLDVDDEVVLQAGPDPD